MARKASTKSRQPSLSAAAICTALQFFQRAFSFSLSAVLLHVVLGLPRFRRPSGDQVYAVLQSFCSSFLMRWPMNFYLLFRTPSLRFSISAIFRTSLFVILSCQRILNIRLRHLLWKTSIFFSSHLFIFHVSQAYIKTGFTSIL